MRAGFQRSITTIHLMTMCLFEAVAYARERSSITLIIPFFSPNFGADFVGHETHGLALLFG